MQAKYSADHAGNMQRSVMKKLCGGHVAVIAVLFCTVYSASAQQSWPAYVVAEKASVYRDMSTSSEVLSTLSNGTGVTVYFAVQSVQGSWCKIALQDDRQSYGFVLCSQIHRGTAPRAGAKGASASECKELVDKLMDVTGMSFQFAGLSREFFSSVSAATSRGLDAQTREELLSIVQRNMDGSVLEAAVRRGFINSCDSANFDAVIKAFETPFAMRMVKLESVSRGSSQAAANRAYAAKVKDSPAPAERSKLLNQLDHAQGSTQFMVDLILDIVVTLGTAASGTAPKQDQIESMRNQIAVQMQQLVLTSELAIYHSASDEDLRQYVGVWESQPVHQFNELFKNVFQEVVETQSRVVGTELRSYMQAHHVQRRAR